MSRTTSTVARPISRRRLLKASAAGFLLLPALSACQGSLPIIGGKTTVTALLQSGQASEARYNPVLEKFRQRNPQIEVQVNFGGASAAEIQQKLLTLIAGGTPPDLFWTHTYINSSLAKRGVTFDLNTYIKSDKEFRIDDYFPTTLKEFELDGKQHALPRETTSTVLVYNKTLFEQQGVQPPQSTWTWEDFLKAAQALTKGEGATRQFGAAGFQQQGFAFYTFIRVWHEGGDVLSPDRTRYTMNEEPGVRAVRWIQDLIHVHKVHAAAADLAGVGVDQVFKTGRVAMLINISVYSAFQGAPFEWDIQHLPRTADGRQITRNASAGHSLTAASRNRDAAWTLLKYLASREVFEHMVSQGLTIPAHRAVAESPLHLNPDKPPRSQKIAVDALAYARPEPVAGDWIAVHREIATALEGVYGISRRDPKEALDAIAGRVNELIRKT